MASLGADKDVLVEIAERCGSDLAEDASRLRARGQRAAASVGRASAHLHSVKPQLLETAAALADLGPLPAEIGTRRPILKALAWSAISLAALSLGQTGGRYLGGVTLSWWMSSAAALQGALLTIPAVFAAYDWALGFGARERRTVTLAAAVAMGVLSGYALRLYGTATWETAAVVPLVVAAVLRVAAAPLAAQPSRTALLGATLGAAAGLQLMMASLAGTLDSCTVLYTGGSTAIVGAALQLSLWRLNRPCKANEWVDSFLPVVTLVAVTALDAVLAAYVAPPNDAKAPPPNSN